MKSLSTFLVVGLISQLSTANADPKFWLYQRMMNNSLKIQENHIPGSERQNYFSGARAVQEGMFNQDIDHFSPNARRANKKSNQTFKQRFFVDSSLATDKNSPVIYYICGEGTCEGPSDTALVNQFAQKYHAHRIALEHRYYGKSQPFPTLDAKNLTFLSMDQAIEDLATFQRYVQKTMGLTGKWITVGGSYPGELSAFYRLKHPELVVGALASSAPVLAKADFFEYDRHVARVANLNKNPGCLAAINQAVKDVEAKLRQSDSAAAVKKLFDATEVKNNTDFLYVLADMAATAIQYGYQDSFCKSLTDGVAKGNVTEAYAKAGTALFHAFGITSLQDSFQGAESTNPNDYLGFAGMRSWMYQSCKEFGFYQIANRDLRESSRSQEITQTYHDSVCMRLFGIKAPVDTRKTNAKYYDQLMDPRKASNIFFTNGANDPWSNLSLTGQAVNTVSTLNSNPSITMYTLADSSHCDDLGNRNSVGRSGAWAHFDKSLKAWGWVSE